MFVKTIVIALFVILSANFSVQAGIKPYHDRIYASYVSNEIISWEAILVELVGLYDIKPDDDLLYEIVLSHYGIVGYHLDFGSKKKASEYLKKSEPYLEKLSRKPSYKAQSLAFKSAFYGFEISLNSLKGLSLGKKSHDAADEAVEVYVNYPRVWVEKGNVSFYTPSFIGGSKEDAIRYYKKAIKMYEQSMPYNHRWLYLNTLIMLAKSYEETGNNTKAIETVKKALAYEPGFVLAKDVYLPELLNK